MSKIVRAVNAMISQEQKMSEVTIASGEYFFRYDGKYTWSIKHDENTNVYFIYYYPEGEAPKHLVNVPPDVWDHKPFVLYKTDEIGTQEALQSFRELYSIVKEKLLGIDAVFDDIIESDIGP